MAQQRRRRRRHDDSEPDLQGLLERAGDFLRNGESRWKKISAAVLAIAILAASAWAKSDSREALQVAHGARADVNELAQDVGDLGPQVAEIHQEVNDIGSYRQQINNAFRRTLTEQRKEFELMLEQQRRTFIKALRRLERRHDQQQGGGNG